MGAAGDPHPIPCAHSKRIAQGVIFDRLRERHERVELGVARHAHPVFGRTQREHPLGFVVFAHQEEVDVVQRVADQVEQRAVAREMPRREAAVGEGHAAARGMRGADQVGPDLRVLEHQQIRLHRRHRAPGRTEQVPRGVDHRVDVALEALGGHQVAGVRHGGDDHLRFGKPRPQSIDHRGERQQIARARAVQPDAR